MRLRGVLRPALLLLALFLALAATSERAQAQGQTSRTPPRIVVAPAGGSFAMREVHVTLLWCDGEGVNGAERRIVRNGESVQHQFEYRTHAAAGCPGGLVATGELELEDGDNVLDVEGCDLRGACTSASATFTYTGPARPARVRTPFPGRTGSGSEVSAAQPLTGRILAFFSRVAEVGRGLSSGTGWRTGPTQAHVSRTEGRLAPTAQARPSRAGRDASRGRPARASGAYAPGVTLGQSDPGTTVERGLCLSIAAGSGAAYECGDLRLAHGLPAVRTLNKARAPVLLYNSQHAHPYPTVAAHVTAAAGAGTPQAVEASLWVGPMGGTLRERARHSWTGAQWVPGAPMRIALAYDALHDPTWVYDYRLEVTAWYGGQAHTTIKAGQLVVVNRRGSAFGAGWWMAGLERIRFPGYQDEHILWEGGDGSTRLYRRRTRPDGVQAWVTDALDRPDSLFWNGPNSVYERRLPGGVSVRFDPGTGLHVATANRLDHQTHFAYDASQRLSEVQVPLGRGYYAARVPFRFGYDAAAGVLRSVSSPDLSGNAARTVQISPHGASPTYVGAIHDPDGHAVTFGYDGYGRIANRWDRMGALVSYEFGPAGKLREALHHMGGYQAYLSSGQKEVRTRFTPQELLGLVEGSYAGAPTLLGSLFTLLDGPRPDSDVLDHTRFFLHQWGGPNKVANALGQETLVARNDARFPALAGVMDAPGAGSTRVVTRAWYNARGLPDSTTVFNPLGDNHDATTRQAYEDTRWPDFVTRTVSPMGEVATRGYDAAGNLAWQQVGPDTLQQVRYGYYALNHATSPGLIQSVTLPVVGGQSATESFTYDSRGNLYTSSSPLGFTTTFARDVLGRETEVRSPIDASRTQVQRTFYNLSGAVDSTTTVGPPMNGADSLKVVVRNTYDREGRTLSVSRRSVPDPKAIGWVTNAFRYDALGRNVADIAPGRPNAPEAKDSTVYDVAGNAVEALTRRGHRITMEYDVMNRLTKRRLPEVYYDYRESGIPAKLAGVAYGPIYSNMRIAADSAVFTYDALGNMLTADNADARIKRSYTRTGQVETDSLRIRTVAPLSAGGSFAAHAYGIRYTYDLNGRVRTLTHPQQLAPVVGGERKDVTRYGFDPLSGHLETVTDPMGGTFTYGYNARSEVEGLLMPRGVSERYTYDGGGHMRRHSVIDGTGLLGRDNLIDYDARGQIVYSANRGAPYDTLTLKHDGLGQVVNSFFAMPKFSGSVRQRYTTGETFSLDALGNRYVNTSVTRTTEPGRTHTQRSVSNNWVYEAGTGRHLLAVHPGTGQRDTTYYDAAGNIEFTTQARQHFQGYLEDRVSYYAADGTLRAADYRKYEDVSTDFAPYKRAFEEYRYDALGRRVLVRAERTCVDCPQVVDGEGDLDLVRRTIWAGDQELWEIQMPGELGPVPMENDTAAVRTTRSGGLDTNPIFGRVGYTYGLGTDRPLSVLRVKYAREPYGGPYEVLAPFTVIPLWNAQGTPDLGYFGQAGLSQCGTSESGCVRLHWPNDGRIYGGEHIWDVFHGTLLQNKADKAGTFYRRNRYYDPNTGRFTQEDPIGLAGGLNLYGYANGDPVSYSDPYGLCPPDDLNLLDCPPGFIIKMGAAIGAVSGAAEGAAVGGFGGTALCSATGPGALGCGGAGALAGAKIGAAAGAVRGTLVGLVLEGVVSLARAAGRGGDDSPEYKVRKPGQSGREAASDAPSWARGERPLVGENGNQFARRLLDDKYGAGNWRTGPGSEYNQIRKYGDRGFTDP